ncbi:MAG: hypothetical protein ABIR39_10685 [Nocardioides sp.]|uniref:hypothetical protein n=1 Tax=Nocardioides sp. TaxID=35761 RepID=UPI0032667C31
MSEAATGESVDANAPRDQLVLDEARRAIDQQIRDLEGVRDRAGNLAGYAVAVGGFLGGIAPRSDPHVSPWLWAGASAFLVAALLTYLILRPREFTFVRDIRALDTRVGEGQSVSSMTRDLSHGIWRDKENNQKKLDRMHRMYSGALVAVNLEAALLLFNLWRG